jgi:hypothetical protein
MTPLIRQDVRQRRDRSARGCRRDTDPAVRPGPDPAGAGIEAAGTAASVPPLSGGPDIHGSAAAHTFTIADSVAGTGPQPAEGRLSANLARCLRSSSTGQVARVHHRPVPAVTQPLVQLAGLSLAIHQGLGCWPGLAGCGVWGRATRRGRLLTEGRLRGNVAY